MLLEETVGEEGDVLGDVLRQKLGQSARDAVRLDGERDSILGALHEPGVVVDDSQSALCNESKSSRGVCAGTEIVSNCP